MKRIIWMFTLLMLLCPLVRAESVAVSWLPNIENDLAGYKVYYSNQSGSYDEMINVGMPGWNAEGREEYIVNVAPEGQYYFVVTAYDTANNESDFSNEASINFSMNTGRYLVTLDNVENRVTTGYQGPGEFKIWNNGFAVRVQEIARLEFKAYLVGNGTCLDDPLALWVGGEEFMIDTIERSFDVTGGPLIEFDFEDCVNANEPTDANAKISELEIVNIVQDTIEIVDISAGQIILEWDLINQFVDGSIIDPNEYEIYAELSYHKLDSTWQSIATIAQPDTSYDISTLRDNLSAGDYEFRIQPRSNIRSETDFKYGEVTLSTEQGWIGNILLPPLPLLTPRKHQIFRVIIRE
jgi:hypothetical protein